MSDKAQEIVDLIKDQAKESDRSSLTLNPSWVGFAEERHGKLVVDAEFDIESLKKAINQTFKEGEK